MEPSPSTPAQSLTTTPVPPTPPPLPTDLASFLMAQEPRAISPVQSQKAFTLSRQSPLTERGAGLGDPAGVLPFSQPSPPPPPPLPPPATHSSFTSSLPDSSLRYNSGRGLHISEGAHLVCSSKPEIPTQLPEQHKSDAHVSQSRKSPVIELHVTDPYDELLSMILDGSGSTDDGDVLRGPSVDSPSAKLMSEYQSGPFQKRDEQSHQAAAKPPAVAAAGDSPGSSWLEVQFHKPVTMKPLPILWREQSIPLSEQPVDAQKPLSVEGKGYTELFIEEEDEAVMDKEEDVRVLNERLSPQAEVSPSTMIEFPDSCLVSPSTPPPPQTVTFPPPSPPSPPSPSSLSRSRHHDHSILPPCPPASPRPPSLPQLTTSPLPPVSSPPSFTPPPSHISPPSSDVPSQHSASHPSSVPCLSHPVTPCPVSESVSPPPAPSKTASPPLSTPRSPPAAPTVPHPGRRSPKVKDPVVGGKPPRSPILSRRSYLSPIRGRRVGDCTHASVQEGRL
ncbi:uncharacterized protein [Leuresthes tenuis]|uniref:uncharacterized protein n=1 Tax=Leuresthes tenuis TaxID=355514 RepID=UPI003B5074FC